jgi:hypothetical protein
VARILINFDAVVNQPNAAGQTASDVCANPQMTQLFPKTIKSNITVSKSKSSLLMA